MTARDLTVLVDVSLITCVVQRGRGDAVVAAAQEAGASGATTNYGFGTGMRERLGILGLAVDVEKEIVSVLAADDDVNRIFERMYFAGELDVPGMGVIYITRLDKAATYIPRDVLDRIRDEDAARSS